MSNNIGMAIILAVVSVVVSVVVSLLITKTIISGAKADTSLQIYRKEVFSNLTLAEISTSGAVVNTAQNVPGVLTTTGNVSTLTPFKIEKGGNVALISITASLDPSTTSYATGSTWHFFLGTDGGYDILSASDVSKLFFPGDSSSPKTFYFVPGQNRFPNIVLNPGSTLSIKSNQLDGRLNDITLGFVYNNEPSSW